MEAVVSEKQKAVSDTNQKSLSQRALPSRIYPNTYGPDRSTEYGEKYVAPIMDWRQAAADEGTYFIFHNVTNDASTTLAGHPAPVLADADATMTKPLVFMRNTDAATSRKRVYLDFIEIEVVTAGASGTAANWAAQLDTGATRYSSGTVETATVVNPNMQSTNTSVLTTLLGPTVVSAESANSRNLGFGQLRPSIEIAGDIKLFLFGRDPAGTAAAAAAAIRTQVVNLPPVILGPTDQFLLALYAPSQSSAGVYKIRGGFVER